MKGYIAFESDRKKNEVIPSDAHWIGVKLDDVPMDWDELKDIPFVIDHYVYRASNQYFVMRRTRDGDEFVRLLLLFIISRVSTPPEEAEENVHLGWHIDDDGHIHEVKEKDLEDYSRKVPTKGGGVPEDPMGGDLSETDSPGVPDDEYHIAHGAPTESCVVVHVPIPERFDPNGIHYNPKGQLKDTGPELNFDLTEKGHEETKEDLLMKSAYESLIDDQNSRLLSDGMMDKLCDPRMMSEYMVEGYLKEQKCYSKELMGKIKEIRRNKLATFE